MAYPKGKPRPAGAGRKKGSVNKTTRTAKEAYAYAFDALGGAERLHEWAESTPENLREFYRLHARLIPVDVTSGGQPIKPSAVNIQLVKPSE